VLTLLLTLTLTPPPPPPLLTPPPAFPLKIGNLQVGYAIDERTIILLDGEPASYDVIDQELHEVVHADISAAGRRVRKLVFKTREK
jgi:hypothetical protein